MYSGIDKYGKVILILLVISTSVALYSISDILLNKESVSEYDGEWSIHSDYNQRMNVVYTNYIYVNKSYLRNPANKNIHDVTKTVETLDNEYVCFGYRLHLYVKFREKLNQWDYIDIYAMIKNLPYTDTNEIYITKVNDPTIVYGSIITNASDTWQWYSIQLTNLTHEEKEFDIHLRYNIKLCINQVKAHYGNLYEYGWFDSLGNKITIFNVSIYYNVTIGDNVDENNTFTEFTIKYSMWNNDTQSEWFNTTLDDAIVRVTQFNTILEYQTSNYDLPVVSQHPYTNETYIMRFGVFSEVFGNYTNMDWVYSYDINDYYYNETIYWRYYII